jgi:hypothetical protein
LEIESIAERAVRAPTTRRSRSSERRVVFHWRSVSRGEITFTAPVSP